jgi:hypothetical protein
MTFYVYGLRDASGIRYIGSSRDPIERRRKHVYDARHSPRRKRNPALVTWLLGLAAPPDVLILAHAPTKERALEIEEFLTIDLSDHFELLNVYAGATKSETSKRKQSSTRIARSNGRGEHNGHAKIDEADVREIKLMVGRLPQTVLAAWFSVAPQTINHIARGRSWSHVQ